MRKRPWLLTFIFISVMVTSVGAAGFFDKRVPIPLPEVYPVKVRNLTFFDLVSKDLDMLMFSQAELTDSKPAGLEVELGEVDFTEMKFGCFKFGNLDQQTWFLVGKDSDGYWSEFYIDQNMDQLIETKERVKGFETGRDSVRGIQRMQAISLVPVSIKVLYKGARAEFQKNLYFFIRTDVYQKNNLEDTMVTAVTASFLEGEWTISDNGKPKTIKFRIMDANGNGCFNDYGTDFLGMDRNQDGYFRKKEMDKLMEYPVSSDKKQRYRVIVPPFPAWIAVVDVIAEFDPATLEPIVGGDDSKPETTPEATPTSAIKTSPPPVRKEM